MGFGVCDSGCFWSQGTETRSTRLELKREAQAPEDIIMPTVQLACHLPSESRLGGSRPAPKHLGQPQEKTLPVSQCSRTCPRMESYCHPQSRIDDADWPGWVMCSLGAGAGRGHVPPLHAEGSWKGVVPQGSTWCHHPEGNGCWAAKC